MPTLDAIGWPVHSDHLTIRRATPADAAATWRFRQLTEVGYWITRAPSTLAEYRQQFLEPHRLSDTLVVELEGVVIGDLMLRIEDAWTQAEVAEDGRGVQAELGWVIDPAYGGRGLATEAVRTLIRLCFTDLGLRRVAASCFAANEASWRLMERVGMRREQHSIRDSLHRTEGWLDGLTYALLADEWSGDLSGGRGLDG